jgi:hypothetical protein
MPNMTENMDLPLPNPTTAPRPELNAVELLKQGWALVKPFWLNLVVILIVWGVVNAVLQRVHLGLIASVIVSPMLSSGLVYYMLQIYEQGRAPDFSAFVAPLAKKPITVLVTSWVTALIVLVGIVLLILPGIYAALVLGLAMPLVVTTNASVGEALSLSHKLVSRQLGEFFVFALIVGLFNIAGLIALGIGVLFTAPVSIGAFTIVLARILDLKPARPAKS